MPYPLLRRLSAAPLPVVVTAAADLPTLQYLKDAGYIRVSVLFGVGSSEPQAATVTELTALGRMALRHPG